ncbi:MAG: acyl-CoA carboxylase subunit beta [Lachnospiraceae bacterium]|nr:acyl-CoA carboxylase subunit beta [Lachnospiraceae bacterium]
MNWNDAISDLESRREQAKLGGGETAIAKQHEKGKLTARERLEILFDEGTFVEINDLVESRIDDFGLDKKRVPGDGVVTGYGKINGRTVFACSEDFTVIGGSLGEYHSRKIIHIQDMALKMRCPIVCINDSGGARIEEGIDSLSGYSGIFERNTIASGVIPQIAVILGPCSGGACYSPAICDYIFVVEDISKMFITGPQVVKTVIGEELTADELGGAKTHAEKSGVAHFYYKSEKNCLGGVRELLSYLPQSNKDPMPVKVGKPVDNCANIVNIVPDNKKKSYDVHDVVNAIIDKDSFFEVQKHWAKNAVVGFGRIDGHTVGFVCDQPNFMGGSLDIDASDKIARFIRFCDCFNIPIVSLVDVPAFLPGSEQEHNGIIRHGAKILFAYAEATVPKITLIMRKAYGGAYIAMNSKHMGADVVYAWPIAEIAVMGAEGAVNIIGRRQIAAAQDPEAARAELIKQYEDKFLNPYTAAKRGFVDEVIKPEETRQRIVSALDALKSKRMSRPFKKHGNIPL